MEKLINKNEAMKFTGFSEYMFGKLRRQGFITVYTMKSKTRQTKAYSVSELSKLKTKVEYVKMLSRKNARKP